MNYETLLTQFEELQELVENSQPEPHLDQRMQKHLYELEEEVDHALIHASRLNYSKDQMRSLNKMKVFIIETKQEIRIALEEFKQGIIDEMYPNRGDDPQDPFDY